ncbi:MAG: transcription repressor NadR [Anaerovoracaceae bacterium]
MDTGKRRDELLKILKQKESAISASTLAQQLSVSRQIIVGDVAILRAAGAEISATPRGYVYRQNTALDFPFEGLIACKHSTAQLAEELYTIVDFGGVVIDVTIDHLIYGQLSGTLNIRSRHDVDLFTEKVTAEENAKPLSFLTGGIHLHRIGCQNKGDFQLIKAALSEKNIML